MEDSEIKEYPSLIKVSRPFLCQEQIDALTNQRDAKARDGLKGAALTQLLIQASNTAWSLGHNFRFPVRTICTALVLFQKTELFNHTSKFPIMELVVACMLVASKLEDTPKKSKELITTAYTLRNNNQINPAKLEETKNQVLALERQILETIGFDFRIYHPFKYIIKICKDKSTSKEIAKMAWVIATDAYSTLAPIKMPSHTVALACIILSAKLQDVNIFPIDSQRYQSPRPHVNIALVELLDYYIHFLQSSQLGKMFTEVSKCMALRIEINKELVRDNPKFKRSKVQPTRPPQVSLRDPKISDKGTVRYILEWDLEHVSKETVA